MNTQTFNKLQNFLASYILSGLDLSTLKVTALTYLAEARAQERYEHMNEIIRYAQEFGATDNEINTLLRV